MHTFTVVRVECNVTKTVGRTF